MAGRPAKKPAPSSPAAPRKSGRRSKAEELDLLADKQRFLKKLPKLGPKSTEPDVMKWTQMITDAYLGGLLGSGEMERLEKVAAIQLRALKQHHARHDIVELRDLVERAEAVEARAAARGAKLRDRTH